MAVSMPLPSDPSNTSWLPAQSWRHFVAGGYVLSRVFRIFNQSLTHATLDHIDTKVGGDVRSHHYKSIRRREDSASVGLVQTKTDECGAGRRHYGNSGPQANRTSLAFCGNGTYSPVCVLHSVQKPTNCDQTTLLSTAILHERRLRARYSKGWVPPLWALYQHAPSTSSRMATASMSSRITSTMEKKTLSCILAQPLLLGSSLGQPRIQYG